MRAKIFLRIAPTSRGFKCIATSKPSIEPLRSGYDALPTIAFSLTLNIDADAFSVPHIGELDVPPEVPRIHAEVAP